MSRRRDQISLPRGVFRVVARGREYFYYQEGRGTERAGERISLPRDPHSPEFWSAIRQAQGLTNAATNGTVDATIGAYLDFVKSAGTISPGTFDQYQRALRLAKAAWGSLPVRGVRPVHVQAVMDSLSAAPGKANNFLSAMRAFSTWARVRDHVEQSITEGVKPYPRDNGHKPWTPGQIDVALAALTGVIRRGVALYMWTGMRGSDAVRLGWTDVEDGGFVYRSQKTGRDVYCPIVPELDAEMAGWEKRPGPFLYQEGGRYTRKLFSKHFAEARDRIPELAGVTLHGLRCTAVIRLRRAGLSTAQIGDIVGMSIPMIERYCRFADRKTSGKAALLTLTRTGRQQELKNIAKLQTLNRVKSEA
jgi:integrase